MEFSRQECWSGLLFPSPEDLPNPGKEPRSPALQTDFLPSEGIEYTCPFDPVDALPCVEGQKKRRNRAVQLSAAALRAG